MIQKPPKPAKQVAKVLKVGQRIFGRFICFNFIFRSPGFLKVVVGTKTAKKAVKRNWLKRITREYLREKIPAGVQLVVTFKKIEKEELPTAEEIRADLAECLEKLKEEL